MMNELQEAIFHVLVSIFNTKYIEKKFEKYEEKRGQKIIDNSAIRYGILNYVAKYSLASNDYFITEKCLKYLNKIDLITEKGLLRSKKGSKFKFTFEHPIPSNIIADLLYKNRKSRENMLNILKVSDIVTVLTYEENGVLNKSKLTSTMPPNWKIFKDDPFSRYTFCGLNIPTQKIKVYGALKR